MNRLVLLAVVLLLRAETARAGLSFQFTILQAPGGTDSSAQGINNQGEVVGYTTTGITSSTGFLLSADGDFTSLTPPTGPYTYAQPYGVNDSGVIVGGNPGFQLTNGSFSPIAPPGVAASGIMANGINDKGQIVGMVPGV